MPCNYADAAQTAYNNMKSCFANDTCGDYWKLGNDANEPTFGDIATSILVGVVNKMVDQNGVILPSHGDMGDPGDYMSGSGVFMRGLLYAYSQPNSPIKQFVDKYTPLQEVLLASANDVCENPPKPWDPEHPDPDYLFENFNVLATLTTAKVLGAIKPPKAPR